MRLKDDFTFYQRDAAYSIIQHDKDTMDLSDYIDKWGDEEPSSEDVQVYNPGDVAAPEYIRRFEDGFPDENLDKFISHVLTNIRNNDNGIKRYRSKLDTAGYISSLDDPDEIVCMNDIQSEKLSEVDDKLASIHKEQRERLAYCLYRFHILSSRLHVNVLSMLLAHKKAKRTSKSTLINKPAELVDNGTYYADLNGDCTTPITRANDKSLTSARRLLVDCRDADIVEFKGDCEVFDELLGILNIDIDAEDPTLYTRELIMKVSNSIMVNNYDYVSRKHGGYNKDILRSLKTISLDDSISQNIEEEVDEEARILEIIESSDNILTYQLDAIQASYSNATEIAFKLITTLASCDGYIKSVCGMPDKTVTGDGFIMSTYGCLFSLDSSKVIPKKPKTYTDETTGLAYFHASGYVLFYPRYEAVLMCRIEDYLHAIQYQTECSNIYIIGQVQ